MVKKKHPLARHVDEDQIAAAIRAAEAHTTGKIVVTLSPHSRPDITAAAIQAFAKLEMHRSRHRNSILFFVAPSQREFAVVGDTGIHQKLGQSFWDRLALTMSAKIKVEDLTRGLIYGIQEIGQALALHFPKTAANSD